MADPRARFLITADDRASKTVRKLRGELGGVKTSLKGLATQFGLAFGAGAAARGIIDVALQTEKLRASLETVTGSANSANLAFDQIKRFTAETPFQVNEVANSFIKLAAYGIEPTDELLRSLGNTASAMGKTLNQAVEALADAATGEFERLKEFGIKARSEGDKVAFTFRGVTTEVGKNADEIRRYLQSIGETDFAGAMERQMDTLGGAFSNLQDSVFNLADKFASESGLTASIKAATRAITDLINESNDGELAVTKFAKALALPLPGTSYGGQTVIEARLERIKKLDAEESRLENLIRNKRGRRAQEERAQLQARLSSVRSLSKLLKESLNDPELQKLNREGLAKRLPKETSGELGQIVPTAPAPSDRTSKKSTGLSAAQKEFNALLKESKSLTEAMQTPLETYNAQIERLNLLRDKGLIQQETYNRAVADYRDQLDQANGTTERFADLQAVINDVDPVRPLLQQLDALEELKAAYPEYADIVSEKMLDVHDEIDQVNNGLEEQQQIVDKTKSTWEELGPTFTSAFEDAIVGGKAFSEVLQGLEQDIIRIVTRKLVTEPLGNAIGDMFGGGDLFGDLFGSLFGGARASGGPVSRGRAYLVGEQGPELFIPSGAGDILPAKRTAAMGSVVNNFSFVLPSDSVNHRRAGQQVAREAGRYLSLSQGAV